MTDAKPPRVPRLFGHPWHAALVHWPMALLVLPLPLDVVACATGTVRWWELSRACLGVGFASAVIAGFAGLVDVAEIGTNTAARRTVNRHVVAMVVAVTLFAIDGWLRLDAVAPAGAARVAAVALSAAGLVALLIGGWLGGELVFRHRIGQADDRR
jgi:uncharacterized membrane protein